jgi:anti-sigma B factor antagonist
MSSCTELRLEGEVTIYRAQELKRILLDALEHSVALRIDLAGVSELDSAGVQLLIAAKKAADAEHKPLELANHSAPVLSCFELYDLAAFFGTASPTPATAH